MKYHQEQRSTQSASQGLSEIPPSSPPPISIVIIVIVVSAPLSRDPIRMITTHIPLPGQPQLPTHIHIPLIINLSPLHNPLNTILIALPWRTTVNTLNLTRLAFPPLLEAMPMDVISARGFAPDDIFASVERHDADGTVAFDWFAGAPSVGGCAGGVGLGG